MTAVIDASVVVRCIIPNEHSGAARMLLRRFPMRIAPARVHLEVASALWKHHRLRGLSERHARIAIGQVPRVLSRTVADQSVLARALSIAIRIEHPVYDCVYIALAERESAILVTADKRLASMAGKCSDVEVCELDLAQPL